MVEGGVFQMEHGEARLQVIAQRNLGVFVPVLPMLSKADFMPCINGSTIVLSLLTANVALSKKKLSYLYFSNSENC